MEYNQKNRGVKKAKSTRKGEERGNEIDIGSRVTIEKSKHRYIYVPY